MCTHQRFVTNRYTHTSFLVKCGKCKACLQEKAYKRAFRIKMEVNPQVIALETTLTYDRASAPYVLQSDIDKRVDVLPVYREFSTRRVRKKTIDGLSYDDSRYFGVTKLTDILFPDYEAFDRRAKIRHLAFRSNNIGICYYPDVQLFKKRLAINLKRKYNYEQQYKIYSCSEYGETTSRPHFHVLIFIRPCDEALFRTAISEAWPFASHYRTEKYTEVARDMANYIASYVNSGSHLHGFLSTNFKPKHSYSKDFGMSDKLFSLDSILEKIHRRNLSYLRGIGPKGKETYINFPIPKYVINRYFPLFKGFSRFTDVEVLDVLQCFIKSNGCTTTEGFYTPLISLDKLLSIDYSKADLHKLSVRLSNSYKKYCDLRFINSDLQSLYEYIYAYRDAWKVYRATQFKLWYDDETYDLKYRFDNTQALRHGFINSPELKKLMDNSSAEYIDNPNEYPMNKKITSMYMQIYDFRCKERKINNFVAAENGNYFV